MGDETRIDWLKRLSDVSQGLRGDSYQLTGLAQAMSRVGMNDVAMELQELAGDLMRRSEEISAATGAKVSQDLRRSQEASANMLKACIAGVTRDADLVETLASPATEGGGS